MKNWWTSKLYWKHAIGAGFGLVLLSVIAPGLVEMYSMSVYLYAAGVLFILGTGLLYKAFKYGLCE